METGKAHWSTRLGSSSWASPIGAGDFVYLFGKDGETTVMRADPAEAKTVNVNTLPTENAVYGVAAVDGAFLIRTRDRLFCVGRP